ncbi:hypothetical protein [Caminibacter sp.]
MKKILFFILLVITFSYADIICYTPYTPTSSTIYECTNGVSSPIGTDPSHKCSVYFTNPWSFYDANGIYYNANDSFYLSPYDNVYGINFTCFADLWSTLPNWNGCSTIKIVDSLMTYCKPPSSSSVYSTFLHAWITDGNVTCPPGQRYDSTQEKCVDIPSCPSDDELKQMAIQKCQSLDFVKTMSCDKNTGKVDIQCKSCSDIINSALSYCKGLGGYLRDGIYCKDNNGTLSVSFSSLSSDICIQTTCKPGQVAIKSGDSITCVDLNSSDNSPCPEGQIGVQQPDGSYKCSDFNSSTSVCPDGYIGITQDGQTQCVKLDSDNNSVCPEGTLGITQDGKTVCLLMNNTADNSGSSDSDNTATSSNDSGSNSNDSNTSSNQNDNQTSCPDPCQLATSVGTQTTLVSDNCYKIIYPVYDGCTLLYHSDVSTGKCVSGCDNYNNNSDSNSDGNSTELLLDISGKLNTVNSNLKSINDKLNDISSKLDVNSSFKSPDTDSGFFDKLLGQYKDAVGNFKNDFISISSKFDELKSLFDPKKKPLGSFNVSTDSCFKINIWGREISFDLCTPLQQISPVLVFVVTLILNFYLIIFSIKHMFKE